MKQREKLLGPVLVLTTMVVSVISSLGAPLIPTIARTFHQPLSAAQWSLTVGLLSGAVAAPVMGRLGDGQRRKATIIGGLAAVTAGGVVAALAPSLAFLVAGRALQGIGLGLVPLTMATARDELPKPRVAPMIALLSVSAAAGVGVGYPLSGLIADQLGLSAAYWFGAIVTGVALVFVAAVVPSTVRGKSMRLDTMGSVLLAVALVCVLVAVGQGTEWGWGSPRVLALLGGGLVLFAIWGYQQLHTEIPLIELRLLRHPAVLAGNVCATVLGIAMYMNLASMTEFVQGPRSVGGLGVSVIVAGLLLIPLSALMLLASRFLPMLVRAFGTRLLLTAGCVVVAGGGVFFVFLHTSLWEAFVMMAFIGVGLGITFAAIPGLIVAAVPQRETGSAMGFYQVVRYVGFSLGSAVAAAVLAGHVSQPTGLPAVSGFTLVMWISAAICGIAAVLAWILPARAERLGALGAAAAGAEAGAEAGAARGGEAVPVPVSMPR